jgi:osmotically-inducible protein OsmY
MTEQPPDEPPGMIGLPPSARGLTGRPKDIAEHASQVAWGWEDVGESYVQKRMRELSSERISGSISTDTRICE